MESKFLRAKHVSVLLNIPVPTLWRLVREGRFPKPFRIGNRISVWSSTIIDTFLKDTSQTENLKPKKRGRPKSEPKDDFHKDTQIHFRVSFDEKSKIEALAKQLDITVTQLIRCHLLFEDFDPFLFSHFPICKAHFDFLRLLGFTK